MTAQELTRKIIGTAWMNLGFILLFGNVGAFLEDPWLGDFTPLWARLVSTGFSIVFLILGYFFFRGRSWPRVPLMVLSALTTILIVVFAVLAAVNHFQKISDRFDLPFLIVVVSSLAMMACLLGLAVPFLWFSVALRRANEPLSLSKDHRA